MGSHKARLILPLSRHNWPHSGGESGAGRQPERKWGRHCCRPHSHRRVGLAAAKHFTPGLSRYGKPFRIIARRSRRCRIAFGAGHGRRTCPLPSRASATGALPLCIPRRAFTLRWWRWRRLQEQQVSGRYQGEARCRPCRMAGYPFRVCPSVLQAVQCALPLSRKLKRFAVPFDCRGNLSVGVPSWLSIRKKCA